jgi:hypothetical protein
MFSYFWIPPQNIFWAAKIFFWGLYFFGGKKAIWRAISGQPSSPKNRMSRKMESGDLRFRLIKSQVRGSYAREKVNEHFSIVSGDCTLHDDSYGCFAVANASIDREIWTNKGDLARVTKYGNILMVLLGVATMNNLE